MTSPRLSNRLRAVLASAALLALGAPGLAATNVAAPAGQSHAADEVSPFYLLQATQATQPTQPAIDPVQAQLLEATVLQVRGNVMASTDDGKTFVPVAVGQRYRVGTVFRTGLRSAVTCSLGTDQMFTLESLTTVRIEEAARAGGKEKTDLTMKYGAASYGIEAAGREYDAVIRTPGSTMAVRGTVVRIYDRAGFSPQAESYTGRALFRTARGATFIGGGGYSVASAVQGSAAQTALTNSTIDPSIAAARTQNESQVIAEQLSQGGVLGFDARASIRVVRGGGPLPDSALPGALPGRLNFALRWDGPADLNFIVDNQSGDQTNIILGGFRPEEILFPGYGLNVSTSGGLIPFDHRGGKNGGTEIAYWQDSFPVGVYGVGVLHASGGTTDFKINAFLDKQALPIFTFDEEFNIVKVNTLSGTIGPNGADGAILFVPRNQFFEDLATPGDEVTEQAVARTIAAIQKKVANNTNAPLRPVAGPSFAANQPNKNAPNLQALAKAHAGVQLMKAERPGKNKVQQNKLQQNKPAANKPQKLGTGRPR